MNKNTFKLEIKYVKDLTEEDKERLFQMYFNSYTEAYKGTEKKPWFSKKEELFSRYSCLLTTEGNMFKAYVMYQLRDKINKISLICHDGTVEGKKLVMDFVFYLINQPGYVIEASGAVAWLLRKRNAPMIKDKKDIEFILDIENNPNDIIDMNPNFLTEKNNKSNYQYVRIFKTPDKTFETKEIMFGISGCTFNSSSCDRVKKSCTRLNKKGGKYKQTKKKRTLKQRKN